MTDDGIVIRISLSQVRNLGRNSQGVKFIRVADGSSVSTVAIVDPDSEEKTEEELEEKPAEIIEAEEASPVEEAPVTEEETEVKE